MVEEQCQLIMLKMFEGVDGAAENFQTKLNEHFVMIDKQMEEGNDQNPDAPGANANQGVEGLGTTSKQECLENLED